MSIQLGKPEFIVNLHLLCDVLGILGSISAAFQSNQVSLVRVESLVKEKSNTYFGGCMMMLVKEYPDKLFSVKGGSFW